MATRNIVPRATGEGSLGTETKKWGNIYADNLHSSNPLPIANGGTGATTVAGARNALGLGNTTGALPIANGGTDASTAEQARTNLGIKDIATYDVLPIANGGTGATTAKQARANLEVEPIGTIFAFAGNDIPSGYLPCNGSAISRETYADLFAVIGTTYGSGDGSTTFNLPNLNNNSFLEGSDTVGTVKGAGLPNIKSKIKDIWFGASKSVDGAFNFINNPGYTNIGDGTYLFYCMNMAFNAGNSNSVYSDNVNTVQPKSVTVKFCIKY